MKMRDLEARTGVNRETIRKYIRDGVVPQPSRPFRNVADYGEEHVRSVMAVRKLQRDTALTLSQIRGMLDQSGETTRDVGASAFPHLEQLLAARIGVETGFVALESMLLQNPKALVDARALDRIGVIQLEASPNGPSVSMTDAGLINIWSRMRAAGFDEANGFPPEILGYYIEAAELVAGKEAELFLAQVEGRIDEEKAAEMLEFALPAMLNFFGLIRLKTFLKNIGPNGVRAKKGGKKATKARGKA